MSEPAPWQNSPFPVPVVRVIRYLGSGGRGGSGPVLFQAEDGRTIHVKLRHNPQSSRSLVNDWIGTSIGRLLRVPVPELVLTHLRFEQRADFPQLNRRRWMSGWQFGTVYVREAEPLRLPSSLEGVAGLEADLPLAALFEAWVHNVDLKLSHILRVPTAAGRRLMFTDHGFIFPDGPHWTPSTLSRERRSWPDLSALDRIASASRRAFRFDDALERSTRIRPETLSSVLASVPPGWGFTDRSREAAFRFLERRRDDLPELAQRLEARSRRPLQRRRRRTSEGARGGNRP